MAEYLKRLQMLATVKSIFENEILKKLKFDPTPRDMQNLFLSFSVNLNSFVEKVKELEDVNKKKVAYQRANNIFSKKSERKSKNGIKCYKCSETEHIAPNCPKNKNLGKNNKKKIFLAVNKSEIDGYTIKIGGVKYFCIFNTGSSVNIVSLKFLNKNLKPINIVDENDSMKVKLLNNNVIELNSKCKIEIEFKEKKFEDTFYILDDNVVDLLIGIVMIKKFEEKKEFLLECQINTSIGKVVSGLDQF